MDETTKHDVSAGMNTLCEHHESFKPFVGTFRAEVKMWMGPGDPMITTGTMTNSLALGGRFLAQDYAGDPTPGPFGNFAGKGFWGYNTVDKRYEGVWIDTACTFMMTEQGRREPDGKTWTMLGSMTNPETGAPMRKKSVIRLRDADHHSMEMFFETPDGQWAKSMHIEYARKR